MILDIITLCISPYEGCFHSVLCCRVHALRSLDQLPLQFYFPLLCSFPPPGYANLGYHYAKLQTDHSTDSTFLYFDGVSGPTSRTVGPATILASPTRVAFFSVVRAT